MVDHLGLLGKMVLLDLLVSVAHLVQRGLKDHRDNRELLVHLDLRVK